MQTLHGCKWRSCVGSSQRNLSPGGRISLRHLSWGFVWEDAALKLRDTIPLGGETDLTAQIASPGHGFLLPPRLPVTLGKALGLLPLACLPFAPWGQQYLAWGGNTVPRDWVPRAPPGSCCAGFALCAALEQGENSPGQLRLVSPFVPAVPGQLHHPSPW